MHGTTSTWPSRMNSWTSSRGARCRLGRWRCLTPHAAHCRRSSRRWSLREKTSPRTNSSAGCSWRDGESSARCRKSSLRSLSLRHRAAPSCTRVCSRRRTSSASTGTSSTRCSRPTSPCSTSATRPTRCRRGRWRSRSGCWPTTARSIPCKPTARGCRRGVRTCRTRCGASARRS